MTDLFSEILAGVVPVFALLHRPESGPANAIEIMTGPITALPTLDALPLAPPGHPGPAALALLPYRQLREKGFACIDDGAPLLAMTIADYVALPRVEVLDRIPLLPISLSDEGFDLDDDRYADAVQQVIDCEIGRGEGANFVLKRDYRARIADYTTAHALSFFRRLLERERGAYWTFLIHTGTRTFVGATPERHLRLHDGTVSMNPISGTLRYPPTGLRLPDVLGFLADGKETDELYMVLDEELKMMAQLCERGGRVTGPYLQEMTNLAHTAYLIHGRTTCSIPELLRETMFAPTVTGSPVENACRVIARHEPTGRGYYAGAAALLGADTAGQPLLDSAIMIRTADIDADGRMSIGVGATIVRHSDPRREAAETLAKAAGLLSALNAPAADGFADHPEVCRALSRRNDAVAAFWLDHGDYAAPSEPTLAGVSALVIDAEDNFTAMLAHQLTALGLAVTVSGVEEPHRFDHYDLVVLGPGPGDPTDDTDPKITRLRAVARLLMDDHRPMLAVCLSHQILSRLVGLELARMPEPNQGTQKQIDLFGRTVRAGFYNTFTALAPTSVIHASQYGTIAVARDTCTGAVHALRGSTFASVQFHPESVLTQNGPTILRNMISDVLTPAALRPAS